VGFPTRLLDEGEDVVLQLHPHWRALVLPVLAIPVFAGLAGFLASLVDGSHAGQLRLVILAVAVLVLVVVSLRPWLRWVTTRYVVTSRRVMIRTGLLARAGRDVPLARITDVSFSHTALERLFGSGTLVVESAGERGEIALTDVPKVEQVQRTLYGLVEDDDARRASRAAHQ
jgi:uncharacterized membrane protein YdbT with pleckstrin-like domain